MKSEQKKEPQMSWQCLSKVGNYIFVENEQNRLKMGDVSNFSTNILILWVRERNTQGIKFQCADFERL